MAHSASVDGMDASSMFQQCQRLQHTCAETIGCAAGACSVMRVLAPALFVAEQDVLLSLSSSCSCACAPLICSVACDAHERRCITGALHRALREPG